MKAAQLGQALTEFALLCLGLFFIVMLSGKLFRDEWIKSRCAYFVFEKTHARLVRSHWGRGSGSFSVIDNEKIIEGKGTCEKFVEVVRLPKLEHATWN